MSHFSVFSGMTSVQVQAVLASAQEAYFALLNGSQPVSISYTQGDGSKAVVRQATNPSAALMLMRMAEAELNGDCRTRRAIGVRF